MEEGGEDTEEPMNPAHCFKLLDLIQQDFSQFDTDFKPTTHSTFL